VQCLLIDKNSSDRLHIAGLLQSLGLVCDQVENPSDDLERAQFAKPQLVFLKASSIPDAQDVLHQLLLSNRTGVAPKVICYAEAPGIDDMDACILAGATDVLVQPFDQALLRFKLVQAGLLPTPYST